MLAENDTDNKLESDPQFSPLPEPHEGGALLAKILMEGLWHP